MTAADRTSRIVVSLLLWMVPTTSQPSSAPTTSSAPSVVPTTTSVPTVAPTDFPTVVCYSNATQLRIDIERKPDVITQTFELCTDTVIDLSETAFGFKSDTIISCGADGDPRNNCTLLGGPTQLEFGPGTQPVFTAFNVFVKGVTMADPINHALLISNKGDITLENCIFRDFAAPATIISIYEPWGFPFDLTPPPDIVIARFKGCLFENLSQAPDSTLTLKSTGIATSTKGNTIFSFEDCVFRGNNFTGVPDTLSEEGYAIRMLGGSLDLARNCFYNNAFAGLGMIQAYSNTNVTIDGSDYYEESAALKCSYVATSTEGADKTTSALANCVSTASSQECQAVGIFGDLARAGIAPSEPSPAPVHTEDTSEAALPSLGKFWIVAFASLWMLWMVVVQAV